MRLSRPALPLRALGALPLAALVLCPFLCLGPHASAATPPGEPRSVDSAEEFATRLGAWLPEAMARLPTVPAFAIAVVVDDRVVVAEAWGQADVAGGVPATADTQFYIASVTKSFTALMAALLDEDGELDLDSPFSEHLHGVELDPALRPSEVRLRDFLTHTSGITNIPIAFRLAFTGQHDPDVLWRLLASSKPTPDAPLGTFEYTNVGYNILGMIIDRETGHTWQEQLRSRLFEPLGMERTTAYASLGPKQGWSMALPYNGLYPDGLKALELQKNDETMQSAGGMYTTAKDIARWLVFQINDGSLDGEQLVDAGIVRATHDRLAVTADSGNPPFRQEGYGLGWSHGSFEDRPVLYHGGGYPGCASLVSFMPEERIGVAVMTNEDSLGGLLLAAVVPQVYSWWLGGIDDFDMASVEAIRQRGETARARMAASLDERAQRTWTLARDRATYEGRYENPEAGLIEVRDVDGEFDVHQGHLHCVATAYPHPESLRLELIPGRGVVGVFEPAEGPVDRLVVDGDTFVRVD